MEPDLSKAVSFHDTLQHNKRTSQGNAVWLVLEAFCDHSQPSGLLFVWLRRSTCWLQLTVLAILAESCSVERAKVRCLGCGDSLDCFVRRLYEAFRHRRSFPSFDTKAYPVFAGVHPNIHHFSPQSWFTDFRREGLGTAICEWISTTIRSFAMIPLIAKQLQSSCQHFSWEARFSSCAQTCFAASREGSWAYFQWDLSHKNSSCNRWKRYVSSFTRFRQRGEAEEKSAE